MFTTIETHHTLHFRPKKKKRRLPFGETFTLAEKTSGGRGFESLPARILAKYKMEEQEQFNIAEHILVPKHVKLTEEENQKLLEQYNISIKQLPEIRSSDPAIEHIGAKIGDVIKIIRKSPTIGETAFYRVVING